MISRRSARRTGLHSKVPRPVSGQRAALNEQCRRFLTVGHETAAVSQEAVLHGNVRVTRYVQLLADYHGEVQPGTQKEIRVCVNKTQQLA